MSSQQVVPAMRVASYAVSKLFYEKLGFAEQWTHQFGPNFPVFASVVRNGAEVFLTEHTGDCQFGALVHFYVPDVDACHADFVNAGIPIAEPPNNSLGPTLRAMTIVDPDSNRLKFLTITPPAPHHEDNEMELHAQMEAVRTRKDLCDYIFALKDDLEKHGNDPNRWGNPDLSRYLEAMGDWLPNIERYFENGNERVPKGLTHETLTWNILAIVLSAASTYE